jgi:hypothetical protein
MPRGRPRKYDSPEQMQQAIDKYFAETEKITVCGLALALGFTSRNALLAYEGYSDEYFGTIKTAKARIEEYYEQHLTDAKAAGSIFALKNFGWRDERSMNIGGPDGEPLEITVTVKNATKG